MTMKNARLLVTMLFVLGATCALHAQTSTSARDNSALILGESYLGATAGYQDLTGHPAIYDGRIDLNLPLFTSLDATFRYGYAFEKSRIRHSIQDGEVGLTAWAPVASALRAFVGGDVGYTWGDLVRKNDWYGRARAGVECGLGSRLGLLAWAGWTDGFNKNIPKTWSGNAQLNYRLTSDLMLTAKVGWRERGDMTYGAGILLRF
jgi:hypothetical protein